MKIHILTLTLTLKITWPEHLLFNAKPLINREHLLFNAKTTGPNLVTIRNFKYWSDNIFFKDQQFDLHLWPRDLNIIMGHLLSRGIQCTKFGNFPVKGSTDIEHISFIPRPSVWPWPLTMCPKIQYGSSTLYIIHCTKFGNLPSKGSRNIEQASFVQRSAVWPWTMRPQNQKGSSNL